MLRAAGLGKLIKPACQGNCMIGRQPKEKKLTQVQGPITGLYSYVIHLSFKTVLPPFPHPSPSSHPPLIYRNVSSKPHRKS